MSDEYRSDPTSRLIDRLVNQGSLPRFTLGLAAIIAAKLGLTISFDCGPGSGSPSTPETIWMDSRVLAYQYRGVWDPFIFRVARLLEISPEEAVKKIIRKYGVDASAKNC